jgi:DNA-binding NarL/FixJ family response regulator
MTAQDKSVLVVDDDDGFRALVGTLLEAAHFRCLAAATGEEALAVARERRPSLVVLDVRLPGISGLEVCDRLRKQLGDDLPIILVSGEKTDGLDRTAGLLVGGDDYLVKPFDPSEFLARVRRLVERSQRQGPEAASENGPVVVELTPREREVLELLASGLNRSAIAAELVISPKTVASHVQRLLTKLGVNSQMQAVAIAYRERLIRPPSTERPDVELASLLVEPAPS